MLLRFWTCFIGRLYGGYSLFVVHPRGEPGPPESGCESAADGGQSGRTPPLRCVFTAPTALSGGKFSPRSGAFRGIAISTPIFIFHLPASRRKTGAERRWRNWRYGWEKRPRANGAGTAPVSGTMIILESLNQSSSAEQRAFFPSCAVSKAGNIAQPLPA